MTKNYWTQAMIASDYHAGDNIEAAKIAAENSGRGIKVCDCGGEAHYKHTIGAHKCVECLALVF